MRAQRRLKQIVLFAGPSIPAGIGGRVDIRGPARRGDFLKLVDDTESLLIFADGCFLSEAAPTHYELLHYLLKQQLLIGTASMGALRAAELTRYGLRGIGTVFHAVVSGLICDDAELAVAMCPFTYEALTVPAVNVRRLLYLFSKRGVQDGTLSRAWSSARKIYFLDRTFRRIVQEWKKDGIVELSEAAPVWENLDSLTFDVKKSDVLSAISYAENVLKSGVAPADTKPISLDLYQPSVR